MTSTLADAPASWYGEAAGATDGVRAAQALITERIAAGSWTLGDDDLLDRTRDILALRAQVDALLLDTIAEIDGRGLAAGRGCTSTRAGLRSAHRISPHEAARLVPIACSLRTDLPAVAQAMTCGAVSLAQAEVIVTAIGDLPPETSVGCRPQAEATMIEAAQTFDPVILARIGRRLAEIIDPEGVQARDEQQILDKEHDARTGAGRLPDGSQISPTLARLLSCDADLVPVSVDPTGNPLDVGRSRRLFTGPIRTALEVRDRGCAWPGCDRPISWTQAHHIVAWQDGGKTSLDNGVLLCQFHHHEIDKGDWTVAIQHQRAWFTPPGWIDLDRRPRITPCTTHHPPMTSGA
ncbi:MAG: HNH endonuclease [Actinomycetota bacterium]|nr:HNH endonuclease [Actinomycetota bacterium]